MPSNILCQSNCPGIVFARLFSLSTPPQAFIQYIRKSYWKRKKITFLYYVTDYHHSRNIIARFQDISSVISLWTAGRLMLLRWWITNVCLISGLPASRHTMLDHSQLAFVDLFPRHQNKEWKTQKLCGARSSSAAILYFLLPPANPSYWDITKEWLWFASRLVGG